MHIWGLGNDLSCQFEEDQFLQACVYNLKELETNTLVF